MRKHYAVGELSDVVSVFGPFLRLGKIAKIRAVAIFRDSKSSSDAPQIQLVSASHTNTISSPNSGTSMYDQRDTTKDKIIKLKQRNYNSLL
ncbi:unnamed protein product [Adineta steineri]|uniref:Uncharacterized protein n=1 Tax=Adineta steineri TaxID=433720 RepID=A0A814ZFB9_9BILA|nr:unnamed protein product [Adineta steineri]